MSDERTTEAPMDWRAALKTPEALAAFKSQNHLMSGWGPGPSLALAESTMAFLRSKAEAGMTDQSGCVVSIAAGDLMALLDAYSLVAPLAAKIG